MSTVSKEQHQAHVTARKWAIRLAFALVFLLGAFMASVIWLIVLVWTGALTP